MDADKIQRKKIFKIIGEYYKGQKTPEKFRSGVTAIPYAGRVYDEREMIALVDSALDFWLTAGRFAAGFEKAMAAFIGCKYCLLVNSGSSANLLAVTALTSPKLKDRRLKPGDEVITAACGFPTTVNPIVQNGLVPVFVDIEMGNYNIDPALIEKAITRKTKAIIAAHTLGNPCRLNKIMKLVRKYNLWFIEDNCDSLGSRYGGKLTGTFGHIATLSFYPPHHITMGEGGGVLTSDPLLRRIILSLRDWGRDCWCEPGHDDTCQKRFAQQHGGLPFGYDHKYVYSHLGYNLKVTDMQASIGLAQMEKLGAFIKARQENFRFLSGHLSRYKEYFILPQATPGADPSWFGFPILVEGSRRFNRADIVSYLEKNKVATRMLFGGNLTKQPAYLGIKFRVAGRLVNTDRVMNDLFWVGVYPGITPEKRKYLAGVFDRFLKSIKISK